MTTCTCGAPVTMAGDVVDYYHAEGCPCDCDEQEKDSILSTLNAYEGDNIWEDVIHYIPDVDWDYEDPTSSSFRLEDGREFRYAPDRE